MTGTGAAGFAIHGAGHVTGSSRAAMSTRWVALIPMRRSSRGLPGKNTRLLAGLPLYMHSVRHARQAGLEVVITTDIDDLENPPEGVILHRRPPELGSDSTLMQEVVADVLEKTIPADAVVVLLQPTSPLRTMSAVTECRAAFELGSYTMVMTITDASSAANKYGAVEEGLFRPLSAGRLFGNRQDLPPLSRPNGAVYVFRAADFISCGGFPADRIGIVRMAEEDSIDIDTLADFARVESRLASRREGEQ